MMQCLLGLFYIIGMGWRWIVYLHELKHPLASIVAFVRGEKREGKGTGEERREGSTCNQDPTFLIFHIHLMNVKFSLDIKTLLTSCI